MIEHAVFYSNLEKLNQDLSKVDSMELLTLRSRLNMVDNQKNDTSQILPPPTPQSGREDSRYPPRLYFGQEFCERLAPSLEDLDRVLGMVASKKMNFTLVTPFVTQWGLKKWGGLIDHILGLDNKNEIVFNDFGLFYQAAEKHDSVVPVLGRLLTKQKRGPRIKRLMGMVPDETIEHFRHFNADTPLLSDFYRKLGFGRFELDNTLQGLHRDSSVRASLYYPYAYVSTTRMCLVNRCDQRRADMRAIFPCARECREIRFCISHGEIPGKVILAGNTQFIINDMLPENLDEIGVDRIVYEPCIPI